MEAELHGGAHEDGESERVEMLGGGELSAERVRFSRAHRQEHLRVSRQTPQRGRAEQYLPQIVSF